MNDQTQRAGNAPLKRGAVSSMLEWLKLLAIAYLAVAVMMVVFQRGFMYFPASDQPVTPAGAEAVQLQTADGLALLAWFRPPATPDHRTILYFHGNAGHLGYFWPSALALLSPGDGILLLSYRGYGGNEGSPSEQGLYADARAAATFLTARGIAPERTVLYGRSLGSGVAVQLAMEMAEAGTSYGAVLLEAPYTSTVDIGAARFPWLPVRLMMRDRYESITKVGEISAPLAIIHGGRDGTIPIRFGERLFEAANQPKAFFRYEEAGHNDLHLTSAPHDLRRFIDLHLPVGERPVQSGAGSDTLSSAGD